MTDKDIIKALGCCVNGKCFKCPLKTMNCSAKVPMAFALDLISRQQAENKELKTENLILSQKRFNIFERIEFTDKLKKQLKSEAIKEFAERLKEHLKGNGGLFCVTTMNVQIDNLVREMVGEK